MVSRVPAEKSLTQIITPQFITAFFFSDKTAPAQARALLDLAHANACADRYVFRAYAAYFARRGDYAAIEDALRRMRTARVAYDAHILTSLADAYGSNYRTDMVVQTVQRIVDEGLVMNASAAGLMIHALAHKGELAGALHWYYHMCHCRMEPLVTVFKSLLRVIADKGGYAEFLHVLRDMHNVGFYADASMHYHIIRFYVRQGDTENAKAAFDHMKGQGFAPKLQTYAVMLRALATKGEAENGEEIAKEMATHGVAHSRHTYNAMLAMHAKDGNGEKMENVIEEMERMGIKPEVGGYNMRISAWAASGDVSKCEELVKELEERGIQPDLYTISTMISCYGKKKNKGANEIGMETVEKCRQWWAKVREYGLKANLVTYNAMLHVYDSNKMVKECMKLFAEMKRNNINPNIITYNTLIHAHVRDGNQFAVYTLRDEMIKRGMSPDKFTFMCILKLIAKKSRGLEGVGEVEKLREQMRYLGIQMDVHMYTTLLDLYGKFKDLEKCQIIWREMEECGVSPSEVTLEVLRKHSMDERIQQPQNIFVPKENG